MNNNAAEGLAISAELANARSEAEVEAGFPIIDAHVDPISYGREATPVILHPLH